MSDDRYDELARLVLHVIKNELVANFVTNLGSVAQTLREIARVLRDADGTDRSQACKQGDAGNDH